MVRHSSLMIALTLGIFAASSQAEQQTQNPQDLDQRQYNQMMGNVDTGYQAALKRNGTDAQYNARIRTIDNNYNRKLNELGFRDSITMKGWYGIHQKDGGTQTDIAINPLVKAEEPEYEGGYRPPEEGSGGSIGVVRRPQ